MMKNKIKKTAFGLTFVLIFYAISCLLVDSIDELFNVQTSLFALLIFMLYYYYGGQYIKYKAKKSKKEN